ncbi:tyrosine-type recombinase/integrase [Moritella sp. 36]|uniref:phage integrase n=1 Tax=Moritella sp. 36 TaxID=2746233 RepID=UPI001BEDA861|nr:tyrosine-type recombinase/integrase [Moritella sp. 36]QUM91231.1 tyrosine-type recombinase/integrase [Moritella sp. 36]
MSITQQTDGYHLVEMYPFGRNGRRIRKRFSTKTEAVRFEAYIGKKAKEEGWLEELNDTERLNDLIETWYNLHGQTLTDGFNRKNKLLALSKIMGNPLASKFDKTMFAAYRKLRLEKVSPKTVNNEQTYVRALFNELTRLGEWSKGNPIEGVRMLKHKRAEMGFLQPKQMTYLLEKLETSHNKDALVITKICLSTGCRWGEAANLRSEHIAKNIVTFVSTKGNKPRSVPISPALSNIMPKRKGKLFPESCNDSTFRTAIKNAKIKLPRGQMTHVLRHTFASHFMMNGGNILVLQRILGHASIVDTMKYSHFAPDHLEDAVRLNPIADIE